MVEFYEGQQIRDQRQYVWSYFQLHASQRLTTFNFYIVISTAIAGGYILALGAYRIPVLAILLGLTISLLSFVFWKLDVRSKQLTKNAEEALRCLEALACAPGNKNESSVLKIFTYEEEQTNRMNKSRSFWLWKKHYSYSKCFNIVFAVFGMLGLLGTAYATAITLID